jgi:hypothetical protein
VAVGVAVAVGVGVGVGVGPSSRRIEAAVPRAHAVPLGPA